MKEFITRTITAFFLIIGAYALIKFVPNTWFSGVLFILITMGVYEMVKLSRPANYSMIIIFLSGLIVAFYFTFGKPELLLSIIIILMITGLFFLFSIREKEDLSTFIRDIGVHFLIVSGNPILGL